MSIGDFSSFDGMTSSDRAAAHPNPAFDFLTGFKPRKLKDLFKWGEFLLYNQAHVYAAQKKFGELVVTEIEYKGSNEALKRAYRKLLEQQLKVKGALIQARLDRDIYGNHFTSVYQPFVRYLKCPDCEQPVNIQHVDYTFKLKPLQFKYRCRKCKKDVCGKIMDRKVLDPTKMHIIRWPPALMDIDYNPMTGQSVYYYSIPEDVKSKVKLGSKHLINSMPREFLEAIRDDKLFVFEKDAIFHMKVPAPSGIDQQWGFPPLASVVGLFLYSMTLRKGNEAVALEHIVPMRVMSPTPTTNVNPLDLISGANWQAKMKEGHRRWRRDPLSILYAPIPVTVTNVGGDGRAMLTLGEVQEIDKTIMAALGVPSEFLYGGLTKAGMEGTLRLIQNQLQHDADDLNDLLQWYTDRFSRFLGWEHMETTLVPLQLIDDTENKQMVAALATGQNGATPVVSIGTMSDRTNLKIDLVEERKKRKQEALDEARYQMEVKAEVEAFQNTLAQQVRQQLSGDPTGAINQQAIIQQADGVAQQMGSMDPNSRKSQLHDLQVTNYVLYSVVIQRLEQQETAARNQAEQQMQQGGDGGQAPAAAPGGV